MLNLNRMALAACLSPLFFLALGSATAAPGLERGDPFLQSARRPVALSRAPETLVLEGDAHCKDPIAETSNASHDRCGMEITLADGTTLPLIASKELADAICGSHARHLKVKVYGSRDPKFLFWGGALRVQQFEILGETPAEACLGFRRGNEMEVSPERAESVRTRLI